MPVGYAAPVAAAIRTVVVFAHGHEIAVVAIGGRCASRRGHRRRRSARDNTNRRRNDDRSNRQTAQRIANKATEDRAADDSTAIAVTRSTADQAASHCAKDGTSRTIVAAVESLASL